MKTPKKPAGNRDGCDVPDAPDAAVAGDGDLAAHVVVAGEGGAHEVLRAVLHPLHRLPGDDRGDHRADVAGVDADLVAEAAPDVRRDDPDLVLGQARDERVERAVGVRGLRRGPEGELPGDRVHVGDGTAGLQRRRMDPGIDHVLHDDELIGRRLRLGEQRVGGGAVAGFPVEDVVVGLAVLVGADHRGAGVEGPRGVDHRVQWLVLHLDERQGVAGGIAVVGDDEGDLLPLEADLVGGQHGLGVLGQGGHPGPAEPGEGLAGDHGVDLRVRLRGAGVDGGDAGVGQRAAQDRAVQHAGQHDVVDVLAPAPDETGVLLALHRPVAARGLVGGVDLDRGVLHALLVDGGHAIASELSAPRAAASFAAAHCTERTMFS